MKMKYPEQVKPETEHRFTVVRAGGGKKGGQVLNEYGASFQRGESAVELHRGGDRAILQLPQTRQTVPFKWLPLCSVNFASIFLM